MGNKITTIVTTFILLVSFILLVAFITTDQQQDESEQLIQEFTETVRYKGYITYDQYINLINQIPYDNFKVRITHFVNNELYKDDKNIYVHEKGSNIQNMVFTSQIIGSSSDSGYKFLNSGGTQINSGTLLCTESDAASNKIYKMQVGDQIQVDLVVTETTFFESIVGAFTGVGSPSMKIITSSSGVILNTKYSDAA